MASSAASLPPDDEPPAGRAASPSGAAAGAPPVERVVEPAPPPLLVAVPSSAGGTRRPRREPRAVDFERVQRLADGSPVVVTSKLRWWVTLLIAALFIGPLALGGLAIYHSLRTARDRPKVAAQAPAKVVDEPFPTATAAPTTAAASMLPLGATSLFDAGVAAALAPLLDQALPGEPTQFISIDVRPDSATVIVQDTTDPSRTQQFTWRPTGLGGGDTKQESVDIGPSLFTVADVDWDVLATLVTETPALMRIADQPVTRVIVQRWGFDPAFPMRFLVYVDGGRFVEAAADGTVLAVH